MVYIIVPLGRSFRITRPKKHFQLFMATYGNSCDCHLVYLKQQNKNHLLQLKLELKSQDYIISYLNQIQNNNGVPISTDKIFKMKSGSLVCLVPP